MHVPVLCSLSFSVERLWDLSVQGCRSYESLIFGYVSADIEIWTKFTKRRFQILVVPYCVYIQPQGSTTADAGMVVATSSESCEPG